MCACVCYVCMCVLCVHVCVMCACVCYVCMCVLCVLCVFMCMCVMCVVCVCVCACVCLCACDVLCVASRSLYQEWSLLHPSDIHCQSLWPLSLRNRERGCEVCGGEVMQRETGRVEGRLCRGRQGVCRRGYVEGDRVCGGEVM